MTHTDLAALIDAYIAIWNEQDADSRRASIAQVWAEDAHFTDPTQSATGRDELDALVAGFHQTFPGHACVLSSEGRHDNVFRWHLVSPSGETMVVGEDTMVINADGLIQTVTGIFVES